MKVSLQWLEDFVTFTEKNPAVIAERLTEGMGEIDEIIEKGKLLDHCCVGKILSIQKHPNADKLSLCIVETDKGKKNVVCGGTNIREGMLVAFAHVGATVKWHGTDMMTLTRTNIRGQESEGMICASDELGIEDMFPKKDQKEIIDLTSHQSRVASRESPFAIRQYTSLREALGLNDIVFHIDNHAITHRPDLFSHIGVARECVALGLAKWKKGKGSQFSILNSQFPKTPLPFSLKNDVPSLVPHYLGCLISIDGLGETPEWMKKRLEVTGWRPVSLPVDITNYVTMETGMPLHSFDADDLKGTVHIRTTSEGEEIVTLDEKKRRLPKGAIVLSDDEGIFDLLGIMGGLRSSTKDSTRTIFLHSAVIDPVSIRRTIIATGHRTDASTVYEKGILPVTAEAGFARALELLLEHAPGATIASAKATWGKIPAAKTLTFSPDRVRSMIGMDISDKEIVKALEGLEFTVKSGQQSAVSSQRRTSRESRVASRNLVVTVPLHRRDITGEHDIVEEVARITGYQSIHITAPFGELTLPRRDHRLHMLRDALKEQGFCELLPLSLTGPQSLRKAGLSVQSPARIGNPIGEEVSLMIPAFLPSLLEHAERNILTAGEWLLTFAWGHVFPDTGKEIAELSMVAYAPEGSNDLEKEPFLILKRALGIAFAAVNTSIEVSTLAHVSQWMHPGRAGGIRIAGREMGTIAEVHPDVASRFGLRGRSAVATISLQTVFTETGTAKVASPLPSLPAISYDITVPAKHDIHVGPLLQKLRGAHELLEHIDVVSLYAPKATNMYNMSLRCTYRSRDRTLTENEAKQAHGVVLAELARGLGLPSIA
jgi:phenylalanyl-tRNA synthetase beta chain